MIRPGRRLALALLLAAVLSTVVTLLVQYGGVLDGLEQRTVAARFQLRGAQQPKDIVFVAVDAKTFSATKLQWPFPRSKHAELVDRLHAAGVKDIVYDVQFSEPTTEKEDLALYDALGRAGGAVLGASEFNDKGQTRILGGDQNLQAIHSKAAAADLPDDFRSVLDHFPYANGPLTSMAVTTAARAGGPPLPLSAFGERGAWIDFRGPPGTIETVSFSDLLAGTVDPAKLRGRIAIVGASAPTLQDLHATPMSSDPMSGPEIQANAIWTAVHGLPLRDVDPVLDTLLVVLLAFLVPLLRLRLRVLPAALLGPVVAVGIAGSTQLAFEHGTVTWVVAPVMAVLLGTVTMVVVSQLFESAASKKVAHDNEVLDARVRERTSELRETQLEILQRLSRAAEWRDADTGQHVERMGQLSQRLALALGMPAAEAEQLGNAAVAHDIGKIAIPDRILLKPGRLTVEEREEMQHHALIGASMLSGSSSPLMQLAETIARTHHERWDGTGYPAGLAGEDIPLAGRICGICDVFDALVSERPYKSGWPFSDAIAELRAQAGRHFDPALVEAFVRVAERAHADLYAGAPIEDRREAVGIAAKPPAITV